MSLVITYPTGFENEKIYIVKTIFEYFLKCQTTVQFSKNIDLNEVHIQSNTSEKNKKLVLTNILFAIDEKLWLTKASLPLEPLNDFGLESLDGEFLNSTIPVLYSLNKTELFEENGRAIICNADLVGSIFFLLTLYEELVIDSSDLHDRFSYEDSILYRWGLYSRPLVNEYLEVLKALMRHAGIALSEDKRKYRLILSHDVDVPLSHTMKPRLFLRNIIADILLRKSFVVPFKKISSFFIRIQRLKFKWDPYFNFHYLMRISESHGIRSHFNFICVNGGGTIDGEYNVFDKHFTALIKEMELRGHIVGFHPGYSTFNNLKNFQHEYERFHKLLNNLSISTEYLGGRQHYLRWRNPTTWQIWSDAGLKYDSSVGSEFFMGFRAGTCFEYPVFNLISREKLELIEYPLLAMDVCAFKYENERAAQEVIMELNRICKFYGGNMTLLFHNNYVVTKSQKKKYERLIANLICAE